MSALLKKYQLVVLIGILLFAFATRIYRLEVPSHYIFDEVYHAVTAKLILHGNPEAFEWNAPPPEPNTAVDWLHPPLAKYTQAVGMDIFGENSFGWRISSAIFGVLVILAIYVLCQQLFGQPAISLLAAGLASLDGLLLVQSRIAMNDIHVTFFILLSLIVYLKFRKRWWDRYFSGRATYSAAQVGAWAVATGVVIGLAMGSKWSGAFILGVILLVQFCSWVYLIIKKKFQAKFIFEGIWEVITLLVLPFVVYVGCYFQMFLLGFDWAHFVELERQVWAYQTGLVATHPYQSRPWQWFLDVRPVWFDVKYFDNGTIANIYTFGNPLLFWLGDLAVIGSLFVMGYAAIKKLFLKNSAMFLKLGLILLTYFAVWLPWQVSPRIMFFYHYTPAVPFLAIILAFWLVWLWRKVEFTRPTLIVAVVLIALAFGIWYPDWTDIPVPTSFANAIYFALPSWK